MPEVQTQDDVTSVRTGGRGLSARPVEDETVSANGGGPAKVTRSNIEDETHTAVRTGRAYKASTEALLAKFEKEESDEDERAPAPHEEGDADEDEPEEQPVEGDAVDDAAAPDADEPAGEEAADAEGDGEEEAPADASEVVQLRTSNETLTKRNRELLDEIETARKTPKAQRTERETALLAAEAAYIDEGTIPALRKFLSVVIGAAADSKDVDAELAGVYADLTARELGVPLDENQRTLRDNARTRLLLARDRRDKAEADKKPAVDNPADAVQYGDATKHVDNLLSTKGQSGTSLADEHPMLMDLAQDFDGYAPGEVIARAIRQEILTGTLNPKQHSDDEMVRTVAAKIEKHYDALAKKIEAARAKQKKPGTTPSVKPKAAAVPSTEQRQSPGARTLTNAAVSRAPAKPPKATKQKTATTEKKTRKDFPTDAAWKEHLLNVHFKQ